MIDQNNQRQREEPRERHLLVVEDDLNLGFLLVDYLEDAGYRVKLCRDGETALTQFAKRNYDLCLLDVMMPGIDGFELAAKLKQRDDQTRFLFLTARTLKADKIKGYNLGAEDYVTKPFDEDELLCKIKAILRRRIVLPTSPQQVFTIGLYTFNPARQELTFKHQTQRLTEKETAVLRLLCVNQEQILRRDDAVEEIYGKRDYFLGRSFDVFISRLRKYLSGDPHVKIENVYKVGFILTVKS